jgi:hypothetical protein
VSIAVEVGIPDDGGMSRRKGPRAEGPRPRRSFTPAQKLDLLSRYEQAVAACQAPLKMPTVEAVPSLRVPTAGRRVGGFDLLRRHRHCDDVRVGPG